MVEQKEYNIPLRKEFLKVPKYKRAKKAVTALKQFLQRHLKKEEVKIGSKLNEQIWEKGIKNPPHHVKVTAYVEEETIYAEKTGVVFKREKKEKKKETPKNKLLDKLKSKTNEKKTEKIKEKTLKESNEKKVE
jgi:large subunit ribosomal protein L31e